MQNFSASQTLSCPAVAEHTLPHSGPSSDRPLHRPLYGDALATLDDASPVEWSEQDIVLLHWRLLQEVGDLANPDTPLEEKLDTLRWIFTERDKDERPFSFVNCLRVVGCSPLSPAPYCGLVDVEEIRESIQCNVKQWLTETLKRYPDWVREAIARHPDWIEYRLTKNPQWINEQVKVLAVQGDLFA